MGGTNISVHLFVPTEDFLPAIRSLERGICFTVCFFCSFFCQRFLDNPRADSRQILHAGVLWFRMCLLPFWGLAARGGAEKGENEIFVKNLCRMRMAGLCQFY